MKFDRSKKPQLSAEEPFLMPSIQHFSLDNSLKVFFVEKKELPIVRINLIIRAGSIFDSTNKKGTSNLLAMCIDEGAGKYDSLELSEQFDLLGARFSLYSNSDNIHITLQSLKENYKNALNLLSLILTEPHFNENDFEREKRRVLTKIKQLSDDPDYLASTSFESLLFGKQNPYSNPSLGTEENIMDINNEDIKSLYKKTILPNNAFVVVVGDITRDELISTMGKCFSGWKKSNVDLTFKNEINKDVKKIYVVNKPDSVQTEIRTGHHTSGRNSTEYFSKHLLNTILGGQFSSRINHNLRERNGYTYGAGSTFNYYMNSAYFGISTSVGIDNTVNALVEIFYELKYILKGITEEELKFAQSSIVRKFPVNFETYRQIASNIIGQVIYNLPEDYFDTYIENINSVSVKAVNNAALNHIHPEITTTVLVGDKEKLSKQLNRSEFSDVVFV
ncbi:M16 family metallopeptidase [Bacteroidota bacterium]